MKAIMSEKLRGILRDPKSNRELEEGILKLSGQQHNGDNISVISVGNRQYKVQFVEAETEKE